jgi:hypothetical protein
LSPRSAKIKMAPSAASMPGREVIISSDNQGPVVNIASWLGVTIMILSVFARLGSKYSVLRNWAMDDTLITIAMVGPHEFADLEGHCSNITVKDLRRSCHRHCLNDGCKWLGATTGNSQ